MAKDRVPAAAQFGVRARFDELLCSSFRFALGFGVRRSSLHWSLSRSQHSLHHHTLKPILLLGGVAVFVAHMDGKRRLGAEILELLLANGYWQQPKYIAIAVRSLVSMLFHVPAKNAHLIKGEGHAVFGLGKQD